jgi:hypothetical protein
MENAMGESEDLKSQVSNIQQLAAKIAEAAEKLGTHYDAAVAAHTHAAGSTAAHLGHNPPLDPNHPIDPGPFDRAGNPVDAEGRPRHAAPVTPMTVDAEGRSTDAHRAHALKPDEELDAHGRPVKKQHAVDSRGRRVDAQGRPVDDQGHLIR